MINLFIEKKKFNERQIKQIIIEQFISNLLKSMKLLRFFFCKIIPKGANKYNTNSVLNAKFIISIIINYNSCIQLNLSNNLIIKRIEKCYINKIG